MPRARRVTVDVQRLAVPIAIFVALFSFALLQLLHHLAMRPGSDFRAMLRGASDLAAGRDIYAPALRFLEAGHLRGILAMSVTPYVYPPPLALALRPLTALPQGLALMLWDACNVAVAGYLFVRVVRISGAQRVRELLLIGALYAFFPLNMGLGTGQIDATIALLCLGSYLLYRSAHLRRAGILLGAVALIKPTVAVLILYFVCRRSWSLVRSFALTLCAGSALSLGTLGIQRLSEYRAVASGWADQFGVLPMNQSLHGLVLRLLAPGLDLRPVAARASAATILELLTAGIMCLVLVWLLRHEEPQGLFDGGLQFYASFCVILVCLPFTEETHLTWLLPGVGLLFVAMARQRRWYPWHLLAVLSYLWLASPLEEALAWGASASIAGRIQSNLGCFALITLTLAFYRCAFARRLTPPAPAPRRAAATTETHQRIRLRARRA